MKRLNWQFAVGVALALGLLALSLRGVDFAALRGALARANYGLLVVACGLTVLAFYLRALRWGVLLRSVKPISRGSLFSATMIGFAANNLLPARLGEFVRAWAIGRQERISRSAAFATVVVERVVDVFSLLVFFALTLLLHPLPERARQAGWVALALNLALLGVLIWAERNPERITRIAAWISGHAPQRIRPRVRTLMDNFVVGLAALRRIPAMIEVALYSAVMYAVTVLGIHVCILAFGFEVPWYASLVLLVTLTLGFIVAPTPGYVGSVQVACVWSLALFGVGRSEAFSYSLFYHASQFLPITAAGLFYLARQGMSLEQVAGAAGKEVNETA